MTRPQWIDLRSGHPDFSDLPWERSLTEWPGLVSRLEEVQRGLSRHPVVFVNYADVLYAIKQLPHDWAEKEYKHLAQIEALNLPGVTPVGHARVETQAGRWGILVTRFLDRSIPYRSLFMRPSLMRYREHLLDAMAGLLVQLHLAGCYWGDCSLSNTLFRRNAGALQAYLVDAETAEIYPGKALAPTLRFYDLEIMEENVNGDLGDIEAGAGGLGAAVDTGASIRLRYRRLWEEITREETIPAGENYRIHERVKALNKLGFSVGEISLAEGEGGKQLRLRVVVTDRNFHRDQLKRLTGLDVEEGQARQMMNEIQELKANLSQQQNRSTPLSVAAAAWLEQVYHPTVERLRTLGVRDGDLNEMYLQVLEHKWYLSEKAQRDVGHQAATEDYMAHYSHISGPV